jgi:hypothetical protein
VFRAAAGDRRDMARRLIVIIIVIVVVATFVIIIIIIIVVDLNYVHRINLIFAHTSMCHTLCSASQSRSGKRFRPRSHCNGMRAHVRRSFGRVDRKSTNSQTGTRSELQIAF